MGWVQDVQHVALTGHASVRMRQRGIRVEALAAPLEGFAVLRGAVGLEM